MRRETALGTYVYSHMPNYWEKPKIRSYRQYDRVRSDSKPTPRVNGRYVLPTAYTYTYTKTAIVPYESLDYPPTSLWYSIASTALSVDSVGLVVPLTSVPVSNLINQAITNVRMQQVAGGVFLGEAKSSLSMITSRSRQILRIFRHAKNLNVLGVMRELNINSRPKRVFKDANNLLLEYRFGWLPLFQDIHAACKALQESDKLSRNSIVTTSAQHTTGGTKKINTRFFAGIDGLVQDGSLEQKVYLTYELLRPQGSLSELFGVDDPLKTAYELLPLSFVVDWFLPIGDFLTALNVNEVRFLHGCATHKTVVKVTPDKAAPRCRFTGGGETATSINFSRSVIHDASVSLPRLRSSFNLSKAITAVELILQRL